MHVIIAGGGITGLTTALALEKMGISYHVYEKAPQLAEVGAGIWLAPNARKVLDWLGIGEEIRSAGMLINEVAIANEKMQTLRPSLDDTLRSGDIQLIAIHRARLQEILYQQVPSNRKTLGASLKNLHQDADKVRVHFSDRIVEGTHLLGADGIHSVVRAHLFPQAQLRYSGQTCWRGLSPIPLPEPWTQAAREAWGHHRRFGFTPIAPNLVYWFAVMNAPAGGQDQPENVKSTLLSEFSAFSEPMHMLLEATPGANIIRHDLFDLNRLDHWHQHRTCLLGDAAHATTPNMGQGGAQGMEDAYYISQALASDSNPEQAFTAFENRRRTKVDYIVNNSWRMGKMAHHSLGQAILKTILKWTPSPVLTRQMQSVYALDS